MLIYKKLICITKIQWQWKIVDEGSGLSRRREIFPYLGVENYGALSLWYFSTILCPSFAGFSIQRVVIRTGVLGSMLFSALTIPNFGPFMNLVGATTNPAVCVVLPTLTNLYFKAMALDKSKKDYKIPTLREYVRHSHRMFFEEESMFKEFWRHRQQILAWSIFWQRYFGKMYVLFLFIHQTFDRAAHVSKAP